METLQYPKFEQESRVVQKKKESKKESDILL